MPVPKRAALLKALVKVCSVVFSKATVTFGIMCFSCSKHGRYMYIENIDELLETHAREGGVSSAYWLHCLATKVTRKIRIRNLSDK